MGSHNKIHAPAPRVKVASEGRAYLDTQAGRETFQATQTARPDWMPSRLVSWRGQHKKSGVAPYPAKRRPALPLANARTNQWRHETNNGVSRQTLRNINGRGMELAERQ